MKKIFLVLLLTSFAVLAQAPQLISYQGMAYDSNNAPITDRDIAVRISILNTVPIGAPIYSERHTTKTNMQGLYNLRIGGGTVISGTFASIPWGTDNKFLKVDVDLNNGTNYTLSGTSQFLSVPYALHSGSTTNGVKLIPNITTLRGTIGTNEGDAIYMKDYTGDNDGGGGYFIWRVAGYTSVDDNGGTVIKPTITNPANGRWVRNFEGTAINVKWFGILGDGVTDYTARLNTLINTFKDTRGIKVVFPKGIYRLKEIVVPSGFTFSGEQGVSHDLSYQTPVIIRPFNNAEYIFKFLSSTKNAALENLNIDGESQIAATGHNLIAAVLFNGMANRLYNNNIVYCKQYAILSTQLNGGRIENNMIQGLWIPTITGEWATLPPPLPYGTDTSLDNGHIGALHLRDVVNCWIVNNEIGMSTNYGSLKNVNRKAVAFLGNRVHGSVISGNIFENGDKGAFLIDCTGNKFTNNRYEFNGSSGMEMIRCAESTLTGEAFNGNSLAAHNTYDDLVLDTATSPDDQKCSGLTFINPIFVPGNNGSNPTDRLPRYNITSYAPGYSTDPSKPTCPNDWRVTFVACYFHPNSRAKISNQTNPAINPNAIAPYVIQ